MFFLLFGLSTRLKPLGAGSLRECARCHNTTRWSRLRRYHQLTLFFIPVLRWRREEIEACPICGAEQPAPARRTLAHPLTHAAA